MAEVKFFKSILEDSYEIFTAKPGMTIEGVVKEYGDDNVYSENLVECYDVDTGKTFYAPLTDDEDFGVMAVVNGKSVSKEYVLQEDDSVVVMVMPHSGNNGDDNWSWKGAAIGLGVGLVLGAVTGGVGWWYAFTSFAEAAAWVTAGAVLGGAVGFLAGGIVGAQIKNKKESKDYRDGSQLPDVGGANNQPITGNPIPLVLGKKEISPFIVGSPWVEYTGLGGKDAVYHGLYLVGYGPLKISDIKLDCLTISNNKRGIMQGRLSGSESNGGDIKIKWDNNDAEIEIIQQNINDKDVWYGSIYPYAKLQENVACTPMFIRDDTLTDDTLRNSTKKSNIQYMNTNYTNGYRTNTIRFSKQYARKIEVQLSLPEGLYYEKTDDDGNPKRESIPLWLAVQWRPYNEQASKNERSANGSVNYRSSGDYGYEYKDGHEDGWITFDKIIVDGDNKSIIPVEFANKYREQDINAHTGNNLHKERVVTNDDLDESEVITAFQKSVTMQINQLASYEVTQSTGRKIRKWETYKAWVGNSKWHLNRRCDIEFKLRNSQNFFDYHPIYTKTNFKEGHRYLYVQEQQWKQMREYIFGDNAAEADEKFYKLPIVESKYESGVYGRRINLLNHPVDAYGNPLSNFSIIYDLMYELDEKETVTKSYITSKWYTPSEMLFDWTRESHRDGSWSVSSITPKTDSGLSYYFRKLDNPIDIKLPYDYNANMNRQLILEYNNAGQVINGYVKNLISKDEYEHIPAVWTKDGYVRVTKITHWPYKKNLQPRIDYCNEHWLGSEIFDLKEAQDYVTEKQEELKKTEEGKDNLTDDEILQSFNKSEIRLTAVADIESFCSTRNLVASNFLYGNNNTTKAIEVRVVRVSPNYINEVSSENNKHPKTFHDNITWKNITTETIDTKDENQTFTAKAAKNLQSVQDDLNGGVILADLPTFSLDILNDYGWDISPELGRTFDHYYGVSYTRGEGLNKKYILATPVGYSDILTPSELEAYVDEFLETGEDEFRHILYTRKYSTIIDPFAIFSLSNRINYTVRQYFNKTYNKGVDKFIPARPLNNRHYKNACLIAFKIKADNAGNVQGAIEKLSVVAQAFSPKLMNNVWYPQGITKKYRYFYGSKAEITGADAKEKYEKAVADGDINATRVNGGNNWRETIDSIIFSNGKKSIEYANTPSASGWYLDDTTYEYNGESATYFGERNYNANEVAAWCKVDVETTWSNFEKVSTPVGSLMYIKVYEVLSNTTHVLYIRVLADTDANNETKGRVVYYGPDHINTSAPSQFILANIGPHLGKDALGYDDINLLSMSIWHDQSIAVRDGTKAPNSDFETEIFMACNGYVYSKLKQEDLLQKIAFAGRAAYTRDDQGKLVAVMDNKVPYPKGILNNQNALSVTISYSFRPAPSGVLVNFKNEENFGIDEGLLVMNDGEDQYNPTNDIESMSLDFVTDVVQSYSLGRYYLANKEYSRDMINWKSGIEGFDLQFGDVIKVNHDMLLVGQSCGRITEILCDEQYAYGLILSDTYEYDGKDDHAIEIMQPSQSGGDKVIVVPVNGHTTTESGSKKAISYTFEDAEGNTRTIKTPRKGMTNLIVFNEKMIFGEKNTVEGKTYFFQPQIDNLVNYGIRNKVSKLYRVKSKTPDANFTFSYSLVPYNEMFFNYGCSIPSINRNITIPNRNTDSDFLITEKVSMNDVLSKMEEAKSYADEAIAEAKFDATAVYQLAIATPVLTKNPDGTYVKDELVLKSKKTSGTITEVYPTIYHVTYFDSDNVEQHLYDSETPDISVTLTTLPTDTFRFHVSANYLDEVGKEVEFDNQDVQIIESGEQGYTVGLTNENHGFPGDTEKALESVATTSVYALSGDKVTEVRVVSVDKLGVSLDFVDTSIPGLKFKVSTLEKAERPVITFKATPDLIIQSGNVSVIIEVNKIQIEKSFSFTVSRKGEDGDAPYILVIEGENIIRNGNGIVTLTPSLTKGGKEVEIVPPEMKIQWYLNDKASKTYAAGNYVSDAKLELTAQDVGNKILINCKLEDSLG